MLKLLSIKLGLNRIKGKGRILELLGFERYYAPLQDYKVSTIFDLTEKAVRINAPVYDDRDECVRLPIQPNDFEDFALFVDTVLKDTLKKFEANKTETLKKLQDYRNWELFMTYTKILDIYGELCFTPDGKLREIYRIVDNFVKDAKSLVGENCFFLIISDHGMERIGKTRFGKHSDYGFYSVNHPLGLDMPMITDFYKIIKHVLRS